MKIPIIVIAGPTASGKTALSVELAKKYGGEIVSADSMQIYKDMNVGTAKPSEEEKCGIVHHLMDFVDPRCEYSVAQYVCDAHKCIADIVSCGRVPIVTGGTGLYINSLVNDVDFEDEKDSESVRSELNEIYEAEGADKLYAMLKQIDPESEIPKENIRRVIRAIEFYKLRGITMTEQARLSKLKESRYNPLIIAVSWDRPKLYERIDKRVDIMLEQGLENEVFMFFKKGFTKKMQSMKGIGYKQFLDYFRGLSTFDEAVNLIKRDSRRYAKRQLTWFRKDKRVYWIDAEDDILKQAIALSDDFLSENKQFFEKM